MADKKNTKNKSLARRGTKGNPQSSRTASQRRAVSALIPTSEATNAYELLDDIARVVIAEPKRLQMGTWLMQGVKQLRNLPADKTPVCGTVGCIAGWAVALKGSAEDVKAMRTGAWWGLDDTPATALLGLSPDQSRALFNVNVDGGYGSRAHARAAVRRIRDFQKRHADQLKAKSVIA